jgi:ferritin-like metal-binding protein YciE
MVAGAKSMDCRFGTSIVVFLNRGKSRANRATEREEVQMKTFSDLLVEGLREIYASEKQLLNVLARTALKAWCRPLNAAFTKQLLETQNHISRLETIGKELQLDLGGSHCYTMEELVQQAKTILADRESDPAQDVLLIDVAQCIHQHEITAYSSLLAMAEMVGLTHIASLLQQTLGEETAAEQLLTRIEQLMPVAVPEAMDEIPLELF